MIEAGFLKKIKNRHNFLIEETSIQAYEPNWLKRNISKMYFINKNVYVNFRSDVDNLNNVYNQLIELGLI